jgi:hypothetical protein
MTAESDHKAEARQNANDTEVMDSSVRGDNQSAPEVKSENEGINEKQADWASRIADGCSEKLEVLFKKEAVNEIEG